MSSIKLAALKRRHADRPAPPNAGEAAQRSDKIADCLDATMALATGRGRANTSQPLQMHRQRLTGAR
ncbi:MAG: hypothetical protein K0S56_1560 [Microvirga sp.]|jgi:hypothetical protein|nr:hypothetical protein [Microvirga sp.]